jgi:hypothetical protein
MGITVANRFDVENLSPVGEWAELTAADRQRTLSERNAAQR